IIFLKNKLFKERSIMLINKETITNVEHENFSNEEEAIYNQEVNNQECSYQPYEVGQVIVVQSNIPFSTDKTREYIVQRIIGDYFYATPLTGKQVSVKFDMYTSLATS